MAKTMHWRIVPGALFVLVHSDIEPSDEDFEAYLADVAKNIDQIRGGLIYTDKVGPSAHQRARSTAVFDSLKKAEFETSIMTGSRLVRGMITAINWAVNGRAKAFSTKDFDGAVGVFKFDPETVLKIRVTLKQLARAADVKIDAFADESGQFQKKFQ
jgi:hypothetical protein